MVSHKCTTLSFMTFLFLSFSSTTLLVHSQLLPIVTEDQEGSPNLTKVYIIHVQKPRGAKFLRFKDRKDWYMSFLPNTTLDSGKPRMVYAYRDVISGFAARLTHQEVEAMGAMDGFLLAHPDRTYQAFTTYTPRFLGLNQFEDGLWFDSGYGEGVVIGVIDSGIHPTHPSFRDVGMPPPANWSGGCYWGRPICNNKLIGAKAFLAGTYPNPKDLNGHGTHAAGIAGGNIVSNANVLGQGAGTASGLAPKAHLSIYKALHLDENGNQGGASSDVLKAIDQAIRDHVDILSMSTGYNSLPLYDDVVQIGSYAAVTKGIVPCAAAGNYGPSKSNICNEAPWMLSVGASTTDRRITAVVRLGNGREFKGESAYQPDTLNTTQLPLIFPYEILYTAASWACQNGSLNTLNVKGKIVLCSVGGNNNTDKGKVVKAAGGAGMIVLSSPNQGNRTDADPHFLPASNVRYVDGEAIISYIRSTPHATAAIIFNGTEFGARPTPMVVSFSSRGPSLINGGIIKPDVIAPGDNIVAAWPYEVGPDEVHTGTSHTFAFLRGTSMSTPHVSGIAALLKKNHPDWSPAAIKSALMTTAYKLDRGGNPITDQYNGAVANVFAMGSGHVDPRAANDPGLIYDIHHSVYIHYLCGIGYTDTQVSAITRGTVNCSNVNKISPEEVNYPSIAVNLGPNSPTKTVTRTVTNVGDANSEYSIDFDEPEGVNVDVTPTKLRFTQANEKRSFNITLRTQGVPRRAGEVSEGQIAWVSGKYFVRSPIVVTFT